MNWHLVVFLALVVVLNAGAGPLVRWVLDEVTRRYKKPAAFETEDWEQYVTATDRMLKGGTHSGWILGNLERILFVTAIWHDAMLLIPSWLAVKVATKWNVWSGFLSDYRVTSGVENATTYGTRYLGWRLSQRFLIGNLLNILLAGVVFFVAKEFARILESMVAAYLDQPWEQLTMYWNPTVFGLALDIFGFALLFFWGVPNFSKLHGFSVSRKETVFQWLGGLSVLLGFGFQLSAYM